MFEVVVVVRKGCQLAEVGWGGIYQDLMNNGWRLAALLKETTVSKQMDSSG